ncbi:transporter [Nocardiopsis sp. NPDC101807]|uniref:transporter n=1 Tax=Nocardiopsis sp. NPDC101807 TaxID=3364339 RepID=UPI00380D70D0
MTHRPHAPVSVPRAMLLASAAALVMSVLLLLASWGARAAIGAYDDSPDANIGAGMLLTFVPVLVAPLLAWPLLRLVRLPRPGLTALVFAVPYLVLSFVGLTVWVWIDTAVPVGSAYTEVDPLLTMGAVDAVVSVLSLSGAALVTSRLHAAGHARQGAGG